MCKIWKSWSFVFILTGLFTAEAQADLILSFGSDGSSPSSTPGLIELLPNTANQHISVFLTNPNGNATVITGIRLNLALGDGLGSGGIDNLEPVFSGSPVPDVNVAITFDDGVGIGKDYLFDGLSRQTTGSAPYSSNGQIFPQFSTVTTNLLGTTSVSGSVLVASLAIDTSGFYTGTFAIDAFTFLGPADYLVPGNTPASFVQVNNAAFTITAVPEPSSIALCCMGIAAGLLRSSAFKSRARAVISKAYCESRNVQSNSPHGGA